MNFPSHPPDLNNYFLDLIFSEINQDFFLFRVSLFPERRIEFISESVQNALGHSPQSFYQDPQFIAKICHPDDSYLFAQLDEADSNHLEISCRLKTAEGKYCPARMEVLFESPLGQNSKKATGLVWLERDIKDYKGNLSILFPYWSYLMENLPLPITLSSFYDGQLISANPAFCRLTGYRVDELVGRNIIELNYCESPRDWVNLITETAHAPKPITRKISLRHQNGQIHDQYVTIFPVFFNNQLCTIALFNFEDSDGPKNPLSIESFLTDIFNHYPVSIAVLDRNFHYLFANTQFLKDFDLQKSQILGSHHTDVFPQSSRDILESFQHCLNGSPEIEKDSVIELHDGRKIHITWELHPWLEESGRVGGIILYARKISDPIPSQDLQNQREKIYQAYLQHSLSGIFIIGNDGQVIEWNPSMERITGYTRQEVLGRPYAEILRLLIPPSKLNNIDFHRKVNQFNRVLRAGKSSFLNRPVTEMIIQKDGQPKQLESVLFSIPIQGGYQIGGLLYEKTPDIIEVNHKPASDTLFHRFIEQAAEGIFLIDEENLIIEWNQGMEQITGWSKSDVLGKNPFYKLTEIFVPHQIDFRVLEQMKFLSTSTLLDAIPSLPDIIHQMEIVCAGGIRKTVSMTLQEIPTPKGIVLGGTLQDITDKIHIEHSERELLVLSEALLDTSRLLSSTLRLDEVLDRILKNVGKVVPHDAVNIMLLEDSSARIVGVSGYEGLTDIEAIKNQTYNIENYPTLKRIRDTRQMILIPDITQCEEWRQNEETSWVRSYLGAPVCVKDKLIGFINLDSRYPNFFTTAYSSRLQAFASQAAIAIENARLYEEIASLATTDELTGISNRRGFFDYGHREMERAIRFKRPLALIMFDIDYFKEVNDRLGHQAGDDVLRILVQRCQKVLREVDLFCRYGGEEFLALIPECSLSQAVSVAERLRKKVHEKPILTRKGKCTVTISLGIAELKPGTSTLNELIGNADEALYQAKNKGRNNVSISVR